MLARQSLLLSRKLLLLDLEVVCKCVDKKANKEQNKSDFIH